MSKEAQRVALTELHPCLPERAAVHRGVVVRLLFAIAASVLFTFGLVPLYNVLCRATGLNGSVADDSFQVGGFNLGAARANSGIDRARLVRVEFTSTVMPGLPWEIRPLTSSLMVHPGEPQLVEYLVHNRSGMTVASQAIPSVTPGQAARYFHKIQCFCFAHQFMAPHEVRKMAVAFVIRSDLDPEVGELTLAYAFFPVSEARLASFNAKPAARNGIRS